MPPRPFHCALCIPPALLAAQGHHPLVDLIVEAEIAEYLASVQGVIAACVDVMPTHEEYIARHCRAATD